ncbi:MAG TPA: Rho termination factor N-terminal domain-containing protein, partial [Chitinophaga sp.]|nr:Rho termination factor N-terminal domain-containing protein [Chitinophaga sp.]
MYDILQLNDMLVPELLDIAEKLDVPNAKKLSKQDLIYKILDKQAVMASEGNPANGEEKKTRKRKSKKDEDAEEAPVAETTAADEKPKRGRKPAAGIKSKDTEQEEHKAPEPKSKKKDFDIDLDSIPSLTFDDDDDVIIPQFTEDEEEEEEEVITKLPVAEEEEVEEEEEEDEEDDFVMPEEPVLAQKQRFGKKEPVFNIEFDGIIISEGVLE